MSARRTRAALAAAVGVAAVGVAATPAQALIVSADAALACPHISDFKTLAEGWLVEDCVLLQKHADIYGPVGRAEREDGGPFIRVRHGGYLYWVEESAFYGAGDTSDDDTARARAPFPPLN